jgi:glycine cleavage system H protein
MSSNIPTDLKYTRDHEWARIDGSTVTVGITDFAQKQLGDVVYIELPPVGTTFDSDEPVGTIESVKSVSEIFAPVGGSVTAVNADLDDSPENVNTDPYGDGWMFKINAANKAEMTQLLSASQYEAFIKDDG